MVSKKALSIAWLKRKALATTQENRPMARVVSRTKEAIFQRSAPLTADVAVEEKTRQGPRA